MAFLTPFIFGIVTGGLVVYRWARRVQPAVEADGCSEASVEAKVLARHLPTLGIAPEPHGKESASEEITKEEMTGTKPGTPVSTATSVPVQRRPATDDFTVIAGIGPRYAARLNAAGIHDYEQLANLTPNQVAEIVIQGDIDRLVNTHAWVTQAQRLRSHRKEQTD